MFYDPRGLISPITLPIKIIQQKLFEVKFGWDKNIDKDNGQLLIQDIKGLKHVSSVSVNRHGPCCKHSHAQLHGFCDSSEKAYCAVVYAQIVCSHRVKVTLWSGRSRVASTKGHRVPRLELMACVLLARVMTEVKKAIEKEIFVGDKNVFCWSDSMVWIKQVSKTWKVWKHNRVLNIRKLVGLERWFYVPTSVNLADLATRVMSPRAFVESELRWRKSPNFLICGKENRQIQEIEVENKKSLVDAEGKQTVALVVVEASVHIGDVIDCRRFGKLSKLMKLTLYVY